MEKVKRGAVSPQMHNWLVTNRHGRLTAEQWRLLVFEPVVTLAGLAALGVVLLALLLPGAGFLLLRWLVIGLVLGLPLVIIPVVARARHYARLPLHFAFGSLSEPTRRKWFNREQIFTTEDGETLHFVKQMGSHHFAASELYLTYYLKDKGGNVLVSCAPSDHQDANSWRPSGAFEDRLRKRASV